MFACLSSPSLLLCIDAQQALSFLYVVGCHVVCACMRVCVHVRVCVRACVFRTVNSGAANAERAATGGLFNTVTQRLLSGALKILYAPNNTVGNQIIDKVGIFPVFPLC